MASEPPFSRSISSGGDACIDGAMLMRAGTNTLVLMSGGLDSMACAHFLQGQGNAVSGAFIDYGQAAASAEKKAANKVAAAFGMPLRSFGVDGASFATGELVGRNAFLIFSAVFLTKHWSGLVATGIHAGTPYFDCSVSFLNSMGKLVAEQTDGALRLVSPFANWTKLDIFQYAKSAGLPLKLTYSCEAGTDPPCGKCASCLDRELIGC